MPYQISALFGLIIVNSRICQYSCFLSFMYLIGKSQKEHIIIRL